MSSKKNVHIYANMTQIRKFKYGINTSATPRSDYLVLFSQFSFFLNSIFLLQQSHSQMANPLKKRITTLKIESKNTVSHTVEWRRTKFLTFLCSTQFFVTRVPNQSFICNASEPRSKKHSIHMYAMQRYAPHYMISRHFFAFMFAHCMQNFP